MTAIPLTSTDQLRAVPRGSREHFAIPVARRASGEELAIHVHVVTGQRPGPTLGLVANIHGDASYGAYIVSSYLRRLGHDFAGTVIGIPVANPVAFESATRTTGQGWNTDMNNMNRVFPGSREGWITQKMAAAISETVVPALSAMLDYHCGSDTSINYTLVNGDSTAEQKRIFDYTRLMGTNFMFVHHQDPFAGTIDQYARSLGVLSIVAEQGGHVLPEGFLELSMTRIDNFMKGLGLLAGEPVLPDSQLVMRRRTLVRPHHGGIFVPQAGIEVLASMVAGGTLLGVVEDPHSLETIEEIRAPYARSAIFSMRTRFGRINPGDYGYIIADGDSGEEIPRFENWRIQL